VASSALLKLSPEDLERWECQVGQQKQSQSVKDIKGEEQKREKKRKAEEERNGAIQPSIVRAVYFVDPTEEGRPLLEKIQEGQSVALYGPRASGKSTRVLQVQNKTLFGEHSVWQRDAPELLGSPENPIINSAEEFCNEFHRTKWASSNDNKNRVVLLFDEFNKLYEATDEIKSSCLGTL
ncbi:9172_t:CDS:2, partial [Ambispora gerdemannii]